MKIIAGMHRSGTSLVARLLYEAGADLGDPSTFYKPDKWNPDGYFEQRDIHAVNMPLINGPFWKFSYFFLPGEKTILRRGRARSGRIRATAAKYRGKVVKENRFCLTLPAWIDQGTRIEQVLFVLRHPAAVARSLRRRNRITMSKAHSLWLAHNTRLLNSTLRHGIPLRLMRYSFLLDPVLRLDELMAAARYMEVEIGSAAADTLLRDIVHNRMSRTTTHLADDSLPKPVAELWRTLCRRHAQQSANHGSGDPSPGDPAQL